jgi:hypothetical protein
MREPHVLGVPEQEMVFVASSSLKKYNKLHVVQIITKIKLMYILFMQDVQKIRKKILFWSLVDKIILI